MKMGCEKVRGLLGRFYDKELRGAEYDAVAEHVQACIHCSAELKKFERVGGVLRNHYESVSASEDLSDMWGRISSGLEPPPLEEAPLWQRIRRVFAVPKPVWAVVGAVVIAVIVLFVYFPTTERPAVASNECIIDKVEAENSSVMVYETGKTKMKIIWVIDRHNGDRTEGGMVS